MDNEKNNKTVTPSPLLHIIVAAPSVIEFPQLINWFGLEQDLFTNYYIYCSFLYGK